ncbi:MAG: ROK family protein [Candidatus Omnitrophica bacterium]|nr:ROK family protein [Candidatus Omnitrophota bacterium]
MKQKFFIGIDVGGTKISAGLLTSGGKILQRSKVSTPQKASCHDVASTIEQLINVLLQKAKINKKNIGGIGLGIPGIVDISKGRIINTPNMQLAGNKLVDLLRKSFHCRLKIGNDVNLGLLGEQWRGVAKGKKNVIGVFVGTGLGGAILVEEKLFSGWQHAAGEIGHMIMDLNGPRCSCGNRGCLESLSSRWAIERDILSELEDGRKSVIKKFIKKGAKKIKSKMLRKALKKHDKLVEEVLSDASVTLGKACISLRHIFDPEMIVFGGGVIEACANFMLPIIRRTIKKDPFFAKLKSCQIVKASLGDDAIIIGACSLVVHNH